MPEIKFPWDQTCSFNSKSPAVVAKIEQRIRTRIPENAISTESFSLSFWLTLSQSQQELKSEKISQYKPSFINAEQKKSEFRVDIKNDIAKCCVWAENEATEVI